MLFSAQRFSPLLCTEPPGFSSGDQLPGYIKVWMLIYIIISEKEIQCAVSETELPFLHAVPVSSTYVTNSSKLLTQGTRLQAGCCFHWIYSIVINCKLSSHKIWSTKKMENPITICQQCCPRHQSFTTLRPQRKGAEYWVQRVVISNPSYMAIPGLKAKMTKM